MSNILAFTFIIYFFLVYFICYLLLYEARVALKRNIVEMALNCSFLCLI